LSAVNLRDRSESPAPPAGLFAFPGAAPMPQISARLRIARFGPIVSRRSACDKRQSATDSICCPDIRAGMKDTFRAIARLAAGAVVLATAAAALAQSSINDVLKAGGGAEWRDGFDTASGSGASDVRTSTPILSPVIVQKLQAA